MQINKNFSGKQKIPPPSWYYLSVWKRVLRLIDLRLLCFTQPSETKQNDETTPINHTYHSAYILASDSELLATGDII